MLEQLISEIRAGGTVRASELAARLQVSPVMVQMILENLERMGRLVQVETGCGTACGGCPVKNLCAPKGDGKGRVWMVK
jgi:predicted ArsR family transcriptional regulator